MSDYLSHLCDYLISVCPEQPSIIFLFVFCVTFLFVCHIPRLSYCLLLKFRSATHLKANVDNWFSVVAAILYASLEVFIAAHGVASGATNIWFEFLYLILVFLAFFWLPLLHEKSREPDNRFYRALRYPFIDPFIFAEMILCVRVHIQCSIIELMPFFGLIACITDANLVLTVLVSILFIYAPLYVEFLFSSRNNAGSQATRPFF